VSAYHQAQLAELLSHVAVANVGLRGSNRTVVWRSPTAPISKGITAAVGQVSGAQLDREGPHDRFDRPVY
jgi:hypothetical protein